MLNIHSTNDTQKTKTKAFAPQSFQGLSTLWKALREPAVQKLGVLHWKSQQNTGFLPPAWSVRLFKRCAKSHSCWLTTSNSSRSCKLENWSHLSCHVWMVAKIYKDDKMRKPADTISETNSSPPKNRPKLKRKASSPFTTILSWQILSFSELSFPETLSHLHVLLLGSFDLTRNLPKIRQLQENKGRGNLLQRCRRCWKDQKKRNRGKKHACCKLGFSLSFQGLST